MVKKEAPKSQVSVSSINTDNDKTLTLEDGDFDELFLARDRIKTFVRWPLTGKLSKEHMSQAGFYRIKGQKSQPRDRVRCIFCKIDIDNWEKDADPLKFHLEESPECSFAKLQKPEKDIKVAEWYGCVLKRNEIDIVERHERLKTALREALTDVEELALEYKAPK